MSDQMGKMSTDMDEISTKMDQASAESAVVSLTEEVEVYGTNPEKALEAANQTALKGYKLQSLKERDGVWVASLKRQIDIG